MPATPESEAAIANRDALVDRLFRASAEAMELFGVYLGDRLGLYEALDALGQATSADLAGSTGLGERYVREWLEQQAVAGVLAVTPPDGPGDPSTRRYRLPPGHEEVLLDVDSLSYMAPLASGVAALGRTLPAVLEAFGRGGGVPFAVYGDDLRNSISRLNRPMFMHHLASQWIPAMPDVHDRLSSAPPARVADVGCGTGWSSLVIAAAYPHTRVHGFDRDEASVTEARAHAATSGLADRVTFAVHDAAEPVCDGPYDFVCAFASVHDMADPVGALSSMRSMRADGAAVLVADEKVAGAFTAPGDEVERFVYGWSALYSLPASLVTPGSAGTGAAMRPDTLRRYAREAGYGDVTVLPVNHELWRLYRLDG